MSRWFVLGLLLLVGCGPAPVREGTALGGGAQPPTCTSLTPEIRQEATEAERFTLAEYRAALAREKLTPVALPSRNDDGGAPTDDPSHFRPSGTSFTDAGKAYVAGPLISVPNGQIAAPYFEFVKNEAGDIYQLERAIDVKSNQTAVLCGCGPVGSGAAPHLEQVLYELPPGATFRGVVKISYAAKLYQFSYSGTDERGERCQPPP
jgi:hypothetical protein